MSGNSRRNYLLALAVVGWMISGTLVFQVFRQRSRIGELQEEILRLGEESTPNYPLEGQTVLIGVTTATEDEYFMMMRFVEEIVEVDANRYCADQGYNTTFHFVLTSNSGTSLSAHLNTQLFHNMGVTVVVGHPWNTQSCASLSYAEAHGMILFSPTASAVTQAIPGDSYLRLACNDTVHFIVAAKALLSHGVEACVAVGIDYGRGLFDAFEKEYSMGGGIVLDWVKLEDWGPNSTDSYLKRIEVWVIEGVERYGRDRVGVLLMGFGEFIPFVERADNYPILYDVPWFGCWGTAENIEYISEAPEESAHLKILTPVPAPSETEEYYRLNERYEWLFGESLDFQMACTYDTAMIAVKAILEAQTTEDDVLLEKIPEVAARTQGASGLCRLNGDGDRDTCDFVILGYGYKWGAVKSIGYGRYNSTTERVIWDTEALGFIPLRPG